MNATRTEFDLSEADQARFWANVPERHDDACWVWASTLQTGYGTMSVDGKNTYAHRMSWEMHHGVKLLRTQIVCHSCDNPPCVNPAHLFVGTLADNNRDKMNKGRAVYRSGESHPRARLTTADVDEIRRHLVADKLNHSEIGAMFGVSRAAIVSIAIGKNWASHITPDVKQSDIPVRTKFSRAKLIANGGAVGDVR